LTKCREKYFKIFSKKTHKITPIYTHIGRRVFIFYKIERNNPGMEKIGEMQTTDNVKIILSKGDYRGSDRVDIRQYYLKDGEYIATKKGINFNSEWIDQFLEMVEVLR